MREKYLSGIVLGILFLVGVVGAVGIYSNENLVVNATVDSTGSLVLNNVEIDSSPRIESLSDSEGNLVVSVDGENVKVQQDSRIEVIAPSGEVLLDGEEFFISITPYEAAVIASEELNESCDEGCEVVLKEENVDGEQRIVYDVETETDTKILGLFNSDMKISADVDAETGEVVSVDRPWWAFLAFESDVNVSLENEN